MMLVRSRSVGASGVGGWRGSADGEEVREGESVDGKKGRKRGRSRTSLFYAVILTVLPTPSRSFSAIKTGRGGGVFWSWRTTAAFKRVELR